jgi:hypothetical protein
MRCAFPPYGLRAALSRPTGYGLRFPALRATGFPHPFQMKLYGFLHPPQNFIPGFPGSDTPGKVRAVSRKIAVGFFNYN